MASFKDAQPFAMSSPWLREAEMALGRDWNTQYHPVQKSSAQTSISPTPLLFLPCLALLLPLLTLVNLHLIDFFLKHFFWSQIELEKKDHWKALWAVASCSWASSALGTTRPFKVSLLLSAWPTPKAKP